ncbi:MAG TPA: RsmE family RNA methyltransferase [Methylomirabilota bacterium]|nr:RsmE family RNA methyltransferase [Methylomirabilota bacterium]
MHRFHLPPGECRGDELILSGREAHHATQVLRLRRGEPVVVLDGAGERLRCEPVEMDRRRVLLRVLERVKVPPPAWRLLLIQAVPKGKLFDWIIQKATELGVSRIIPLLTERTISELDPRAAVAKREKWRLIAVEAAKQCDAPWLPEIDAPVSIDALIEDLPEADLHLAALLDSRARHPRLCLEDHEKRTGHFPSSVGCWIGPEGDFTPAEASRLIGKGIHPVTLGDRILRCETATLYCLSVLSHELRFRKDLNPSP